MSKNIKIVGLVGLWLGSVVLTWTIAKSDNENDVLELNQRLVDSDRRYKALLFSNENSKSVAPDRHDNNFSRAEYQNGKFGLDQLNFSDPIACEAWVLKMIEGASIGDFPLICDKLKDMGVVPDYKLIRAWAAHDPEKSLAYVLSDRQTVGLSTAVLGVWAETSPQDALRWVDQEALPSFQNNLRREIIGAVASKSIEEATKMVEASFASGEVSAGYARLGAYDVIVPFVAMGEVERAHAWFSNLPNEKLRGRVCTSITERFFLAGPIKAVEWVESLSEADDREVALNSLIENWGYKDPGSAEDWIAKLPQNDKEIAEVAFVKSYVIKSPERAADWLDASTSKANYQDLLIGFAEGCTHSDPYMALNYAFEIQNDDQRSSMLQSALLCAGDLDARISDSWLKDNDVSPEIIEMYRKHIRN